MSVVSSPSTPQNISFLLESPTTIYNLPVEILLYIFTFNTRHNFDHVHSPSRTTRHTSQVCKQWRYISLNCPALWAQSIDFKDPMIWLKKVTTRCGTLPIDMIIPSVTDSLIKSCADENLEKENLHRTSPRPIDLVRRWDSPMCYDAKVLAPWFFHLPQCRSVTLKISAMVWETFNLDKVDLSHLESLTVVEAGATLEPRLLKLWKAGAFVGETTWNLRSLTLSGCITAFDAYAFRGLLELTVHHVPSGLSLLPIEWINVLSNMPALKHLELINTTLTTAYYNLEEAEISSTLSASLPQLERLLLEAPLHHCSYIFDHLDIPSSCNINIAACGFSSITTPFHHLVAAIERHFDSSKTPCSRSLLASLGLSSCIINLTRPNNSQGIQDSGGSLSLSVIWNNHIVNPMSHTFIDPLVVFSTLTSAIRKPCASVNNLNLVIVDITIENKRKHHQVLDTFLSPFDRLESIEDISFSTFQFLLPCLREPSRFKELLPCLRAISFLDINFANFKMGEFGLLRTLLYFVRSRLPNTGTPTTSESGSSDGDSVGKTPITDIRFRFCRAVREKAVKMFERFGVTVLRDGVTLGYV